MKIHEYVLDSEGHIIGGAGALIILTASGSARNYDRHYWRHVGHCPCFRCIIWVSRCCHVRFLAAVPSLGRRGGSGGSGGSGGFGGCWASDP